MDETTKEVVDQLDRNYYCVLDGFLGKDAGELGEEVQNLQREGKMKSGVLAGGTTGHNLSYSHDKVRGDVVCWVNGSEPNFKVLPK
jgi:hypothetical protein